MRYVIRALFPMCTFTEFSRKTHGIFVYYDMIIGADYQCIIMNSCLLFVLISRNLHGKRPESTRNFRETLRAIQTRCQNFCLSA